MNKQIVSYGTQRGREVEREIKKELLETINKDLSAFNLTKDIIFYKG